MAAAFLAFLSLLLALLVPRVPIVGHETLLMPKIYSKSENGE